MSALKSTVTSGEEFCGEEYGRWVVREGRGRQRNKKEKLMIAATLRY